jgi:uncharacterized membrane-anchored protein YjiN (DUF445 family)
MTAPPPVRSEAVRADRLRVTKRQATALLGAVAVVWVIVTVVWGRHNTLAGYVQATAEASLVGGLADWFAVTALFRHPLGLPIPHTAIIAERKQQFGTTLGEFIQESFLTPAAIVERVRNARVVDRAIAWLASPANAARVAAQLADGAVALVDTLSDEEIRDAIEEVVRDRFERVRLAPVAGRAVRYVTRDDRHVWAIDAALRGLDSYLGAHGDDLRERLGGHAPWWLPGAVEDRIFERLLDGARVAVQDMVGHPENPLRRDLDKSIASLAERLETSPDLLERGEALKRDLLAQPQVREWAGMLWQEAKAALRAQAAEGDSQLRQRLAAAIVSTAERLRTDAVLRTRVDDAVEQAVVYVASRFDGEIAELISGTISRWDSGETSRRLELLLGPDLQYIRINGTVVGGLAGLALYSLSRV